MDVGQCLRFMDLEARNLCRPEQFHMELSVFGGKQYLFAILVSLDLLLHVLGLCVFLLLCLFLWPGVRLFIFAPVLYSTRETLLNDRKSH